MGWIGQIGGPVHALERGVGHGSATEVVIALQEGASWPTFGIGPDVAISG
jgi:hypothetical protein